MRFIRPTKLFRRFSSRGDNSNNISSPPLDPPTPVYPALTSKRQRLRKTRSLPKLRRKRLLSADPDVPLPALDKQKSLDSQLSPSTQHSDSETLAAQRTSSPVIEDLGEDDKAPEVSEKELELDGLDSDVELPLVLVEAATPDVVQEVGELVPGRVEPSEQRSSRISADHTSTPTRADIENKFGDTSANNAADSPATLSPQSSATDQLIRPPSIIDRVNANLVHTLLDSPLKGDNILNPTTPDSLPFRSEPLLPSAITDIIAMVQRKIWVKRPGASATLVQIREDDLVDDVRDMILRKYANSLGKTFDAPDMTLSIASRSEQGAQRLLGPEEEMCRTLDTEYPGGQTVEEALIINVPQRRTPRPSPRAYVPQQYQAMDEYRPHENGTDYFPPMPMYVPSTIPQTSGSHDSRSSQQHHHSIPAQGEQHPRSISVLNTGQLPPLPSPGATSRRHQHQHRPKYQRQPTNSPTIMTHPNAGAVAVNPASAVDPPPRIPHRQSTRPRMDSTASDHPNGIAPVPPPLPTPPATEAGLTNRRNSNPPTPSAFVNNANNMTLHHPQKRPRKARKTTPESKPSSRSRGRNETATGPSVSSALESAAVPPINVLIVEDNVINLKILEGLMKRLKVRWQTAMNGQIAVDKYKSGGFHLVLMDIQMPVMNGLQATKEIRRLERVNGIGVFGEVVSPLGHTRKSSEAGVNGDSKPANENGQADKLQMSEGLFKSPVIIVALTASSLQSDRHEALAAGCNDFLTKPVNFVWLERKVKEWGCMQALIDYDGWKRWKDFAAEQEAGKSEDQKAKDRELEEKQRVKAEKMAKLQEMQRKQKEERDNKKKRSSLNASDVVETVEENGGKGEKLTSPTPQQQPPVLASTAEEADGTNIATEALRNGAQVLKDANFHVDA